MTSLFTRVADLVRLLAYRMLPTRHVRIGSSRIWLSRHEADCMDQLSLLADSAELAQPLLGNKVMALITSRISGKAMRLEYLLADKSAVDALLEAEEDEYGILKADISGKVFLDFGANVGDFTIACALKGARVHAYEPNPVLFDLLMRNLQANQVTARVNAYPLGVWHSSGTTEAAYDPRGSGAGRLLESGENRTFRRAVKFDLIRASDAVRTIEESIDFMKIDIEGAEYPVLEELMNSGQLSQVRAGAIEYHNGVKNLAGILEVGGFDVQIREKSGSYGILRFSKRQV